MKRGRPPRGTDPIARLPDPQRPLSAEAKAFLALIDEDHYINADQYIEESGGLLVGFETEELRQRVAAAVREGNARRLRAKFQP